MFDYLSQGIVWGFVAGILPGPLIAFFVSQSIATGWRRTLPVVLAPVISDIPIIALVFLLLTQLSDNETFIIAVDLIGGLFILYLAYDLFKSSQQSVELADIPTDAVNQNLIKAVMINFLNPNPYIFWGVIAGPVVIEGWSKSPLYGLSYVGGFYGVMLSLFVGWIVFAGQARNLSPKAIQRLNQILAVLLLLFGCWQLWDGVRMWLF